MERIRDSGPAGGRPGEVEEGARLGVGTPTAAMLWGLAVVGWFGIKWE